MRRRGAGVLQLLLISVGLAFVIRYLIQFGWSGSTRLLDVDRNQAWHPGGSRSARCR